MIDVFALANKQRSPTLFSFSNCLPSSLASYYKIYCSSFFSHSQYSPIFSCQRTTQNVWMNIYCLHNFDVEHLFEFDDGTRWSCSIHFPIGEPALLSLLALENSRWQILLFSIADIYQQVSQCCHHWLSKMALLFSVADIIILGGRHLPAGNWRSGHIKQKQMDLPSTLTWCWYYTGWWWWWIL